ncbi:TerD family protein [Oceanirhabdus seepicola]|uniref:TerD family protein n=1 Tax=Oceanirhabdus seepicola TaxID=2828781 RepID=A0A9J6PF08_9CLOT|nr:TerD family protein [Oceanirhabdus seepicola]MCM1992824.1 TerD family protein [Oceanirhabdus seepicola]
MSLKINNGYECAYVSQKRKYNNLTIETSIRTNSNNSIILGTPVHTMQRNTVNNSHSQQNNIDTNLTQNNNSILKHIDTNLRNSINSTTSLTMKRGQKISITQKTSDISKLLIGMEWDVTPTTQGIIDLDTSIFMVDINNKTEEDNFIFYNNPKSRCGGIHLSGDHKSSLKNAFNETIQLSLNSIPEYIEKLAITVTIDDADTKNQNFSQISNAHFTIIDPINKNEILHYKFNDNLSIETAIVIAEIYRYKGEWKINTIGSGFRGGLQALCDNYGIETQ